MAREATCFSCRHVLLVSPDAQGRWLTCPRCLASVGNPFVLLPAQPPAAPTSPPVTNEAQPPPTESGVCPWCDQRVQPTWRVCPHCERPLRAVSRRAGAHSTDDEVRQDSRVGFSLVGVLVGLLVVGLSVFFSMGGGNLAAASPEGTSVLVIGIGVLVAIAIGLIVIVSTTKDPAVTAVSGVVGGLALGGGAVLLVVALSCLAVMAMITNILTCKCH